MAFKSPKSRPKRSKAVLAQPGATTRGPRITRGRTEKNKHAGGPTKYTPEIHKKIIDAISSGQRLFVACALAGISSETARAWCRRGNEGEEPFKQFAEDMRRADGIAEALCVRSIMKAGDGGDWRASLTWLERRRSKHWGKSQDEQLKVEVSGGSAEAPLHVNVIKWGKGEIEF